MSVFNPKILDASIRDVTTSLRDHEKVDVLLHAMDHLDLQRSRVLIENAVQSCLLINNLSSTTMAKARLVRAKARLASGLHTSAHKDLQAILRLEPDHLEAKSLMLEHVGNPGKSLQEPNGPPGFSNEVWREICSWLPPADLKTLLLIPHALSRIASQLLFEKIDIYFTSDRWDSQRSADILTRIILDLEFAKHVKTLRIFYLGRDTVPMTFQTGMLANALPKLVNLRNVHCAMRWRDLLAVLKIIESSNHRLRGLSLMPSDGTVDVKLPRFKHITQFSIMSRGGSTEQVNEFLLQNKTTVRSITLHNLSWAFPGQDVISIRNLTHLDFLGAFPVESRAVADILGNGHQLESLRLQCVLDCAPSAQFREHKAALPFLRHFAFSLLGYSLNDHDLFPAVSDFLRNRKNLKTLHLTVPSAEWAQRRLGYDATVWGVLPSLEGLHSLTVTLPKDVAAAVAMWLVPRSVQALSLMATPSSDQLGFVAQLRPGLPPNLCFIGLTHFPVEDVTAVVEQGFPMVRVARVGDSYYSVAKLDGKVELEEWPAGRSQAKINEWLEYYGCKNAEWRSQAEFL